MEKARPNKPTTQKELDAVSLKFDGGRLIRVEGGQYPTMLVEFLEPCAECQHPVSVNGVWITDLPFFIKAKLRKLPLLEIPGQGYHCDNSPSESSCENCNDRFKESK